MVSQDFEIKVDWLGRDSADPLERVAAAEIGIVLPDGRNLTKIEDTFAQTVRRTARLSAHDMASWFAANWWRLRWEPFADTSGWRMAHHMAAAGGGFVWPDIVFASDGRDVQISARPTAGAAFESIVYLTGGEATVDAEMFERVVDRFVGTTVARLCAMGLETVELVTAWREIQDERRDPDMTAYRRLEAISGFNPDEAPASVMEERLALARDWGVEAVEDVVAASLPGATIDLKVVLEGARRRTTPAIVPEAAALRAAEPRHDRATPWAVGYRLADEMRRRCGLGVDPIDDGLMAELFGFSAGAAPTYIGGEPIPIAFRAADSMDALDVHLPASGSNARRFQFMRLIGGHLTASAPDRFVPATRAATARQKAQRAFAAGFLCPIDGLRDLFGVNPPEGDDIDAAAERYGVSSRVVENIWANRRTTASAPT